MTSETGRLIILIGILLLVAGVIIYFFHDHLQWIGKLPGDIRVEKDNFKFYFPIATMILVSIILSLVLWLVRRFGG